MLIADVKRVMRLLPSSFYFRMTIIMSVILCGFGIFNALTLYEDSPNMGLTMFWCAYPVIMVATQILRIEMPFMVRTSPHRKRMVTLVPVVFQVLLELFMWCVVLVLFHLVKERYGLSQPKQLVLTLSFVISNLVFSMSTAVTQKAKGIFMQIVIGAILFAFFGLAFFVFYRWESILTKPAYAYASAFAWVNAGTLSVIVLIGTCITALTYHAVLRVFSRRMISEMAMNQIKG